MPLALVFALVLACTAPPPDPSTTTTPTPTEPAPPRLLISGYNSEVVHIVDGDSGDPVGELPGVPGAQSVHRGPDGHLYAVAEKLHQVVRFDGESLEPMGVFVQAGSVDGPTAAVFGSDGDLYVCGYGSNDVVRFDGSTGALVGTAVAAGLGGLAGPDAGMQFLADGSLLVPGFDSNSLIRYSLAGDLLGVLADTDDGISAPRSLIVHEGRILLTNWRASEVLSVSLDGSQVSRFAQVAGPTGITVHPTTGEILVIDNQSDVRRLDPTTGEDMGRLVRAKQVGIEGGNFLSWL